MAHLHPMPRGTAARATDSLARASFGLAPCHRTAGQEQGFAKVLPHDIEIVDDHHDRALFSVPALDEVDQVGDGSCVDGVEGLIEQDEIRILHQYPREQRPLQLAARQRVDRPLLEALHPDGRKRFCDRFTVLGAIAAEKTAPRPQAKRDQIDDAGRKRPVQFRQLRQIGDLHALRDGAGAGHRLQDTDDSLHQSRLAGSVRTNHRSQRPLGDHPIQVMNRRMAVVAQRQVFKGHACRHSYLPTEADAAPALDGRVCYVITFVNQNVIPSRHERYRHIPRSSHEPPTRTESPARARGFGASTKADERVRTPRASA